MSRAAGRRGAGSTGAVALAEGEREGGRGRAVVGPWDCGRARGDKKKGKNMMRGSHVLEVDIENEI